MPPLTGGSRANAARESGPDDPARDLSNRLSPATSRSTSTHEVRMDGHLVPARSLIRIPRQERSIATVHAILDATLIAVAEKGAAFNMNRVAEVAGIGSGPIYQYFANREMLLAGVVERAVMEIEATVRARIEEHRSASPDERIRVWLEALADAFEPYARLITALEQDAPALVRERSLDLDMRLRELALEVVASRGIPLSQAMSSALYVALGGVELTLLRWFAERPPDISRPLLLDRLGAMLRSLSAPVGEQAMGRY